MAVDKVSTKTKRKRNKNKVSFDEEVITKTNAEVLLSEQNNITESLENQALKEPKVKRKKKRKISEVTDETIPTEVKKSKEETQDDVDEAESETSKPKEEKKESIRSQKRKKHAKLLEEKKLKVELQYQQKALNYLSKWKHSRSEWKFEKLRQVWLQKNFLDDSKVPDEFWDTLVQYLSGAKGRSRQEVLDEALKIIEREDPDDEETSEEFKCQLTRARNIVQILQ